MKSFFTLFFALISLDVFAFVDAISLSNPTTQSIPLNEGTNETVYLEVNVALEDDAVGSVGFRLKPLDNETVVWINGNWTGEFFAVMSAGKHEVYRNASPWQDTTQSAGQESTPVLAQQDWYLRRTDSVRIGFKPDAFGDNFWGDERSRQVLLSFGGGSDFGTWSNTIPLTFVRLVATPPSNPPVIVGPPPGHKVEPNSEGKWQMPISVYQDGELVTDLSEYGFSWRRAQASQNVFWNGSIWQNFQVYVPFSHVTSDYQVSTDGSGRAMVALDYEDNDFWDGPAGTYFVSVRRNDLQDAPASTYTEVRALLAPPKPTEILVDQLVFRKDQVAIVWTDRLDNGAQANYEYKVGIQKITDNSWLDPDWWSKPIRGTRFSLNNPTDPFLARIEQQAAYRILVYRLNPGGDFEQHSYNAATVEVIAEKPEPAVNPSLLDGTIRVSSNYIRVTSTGGAIPYHIRLVSNQPGNLAGLIYALPDGAEAKKLYFGLRSFDGTWITPDWRRSPRSVFRGDTFNSTLVGLETMAMTRPFEAHRWFDLVVAAGDLHSRSEYRTIATLTYDDGSPPPAVPEERVPEPTSPFIPFPDFELRSADVVINLNQWPNFRSEALSFDPNTMGIVVASGAVTAKEGAVQVLLGNKAVEYDLNDPVLERYMLVFRLYETQEGMPQTAVTSQGLSLKELLSEGAHEKVSQQLLSVFQEVQTTNSATKHPSSLVPRPIDDPYRLCAFLTSTVSGELPPEPQIMINNSWLHLKLQLRYGDREIDLLQQRPQLDSIAQDSIPVHYRVKPEFRLLKFNWLVDGVIKSFRYHRDFPGQVAANYGDRIQPTAEWLHPWRDETAALPSLVGDFLIFRKVGEQFELVEKRLNQKELVFDEAFQSDANYRIVFAMNDAFGLRQQIVQDVASVRDIRDAHFVLTFGGRQSAFQFIEDSYTEVYQNTHQDIFTQYTGSEYFAHSFLIQTRELTREVPNPISGTIELETIPAAEVKFGLVHKLKTSTIYDNDEYFFSPSKRHVIDQPPKVVYCSNTDENNPVPLSEAFYPFPFHAHTFTAVDSWTEREYPIPGATVTVSYDPALALPICDPVGEWFQPLGSISLVPENPPLVWHYGTQKDPETEVATSTMFPFEFPVNVRLDRNKYEQSKNLWQVGVELSNPNSNTPVVYETKSMQAVFGDISSQLNAGEAVGEVQLNVDFSKFEDLQTWWARLKLNSDDAIINPLVGGKPMVRMHLSIFKSGADFSNPNDPATLALSARAHGGGIPMTIELGEPTNNEPLRAFDYNAFSPSTVRVTEGDVRRVVLVQTLDVNPKINRQKLRQGTFLWQLRSRFGYFDGNHWTHLATRLTSGQVPFLEDVTVELYRERNQIEVKASLLLEQLPPSFWQEPEQGLDVLFGLAYQPGAASETAELVEAGNPSAEDRYTLRFTRQYQGAREVLSPRLFENGLTEVVRLADLTQGMSLEMIEALDRCFAGEPFIFEAESRGVPITQTWVVATESSTQSKADQAPLVLPDNIYAWLNIAHDPAKDDGRHRVWVAPFPAHLSPWRGFNYSGRTALAVDHEQTTWQSRQNIVSRFVPPSESLFGHYEIVILVPDSFIEREPLLGPEQGRWASNEDLTQFLRGNPALEAWGASQTHNRVINVTYPTKSSEQKIVNVQFWDLTGRAQETRTMATHAPINMLDQITLSGAVEYDAFGRVVKAAKSFPASKYDYAAAFANSYYQGPTALSLRMLLNAATIGQTFQAAENYWQTGSAGGANNGSISHIKDPTYPYAETVFEEDASRSRVLASLPPGGKARDDNDVLRFNRSHHFLVRAFVGASSARPADTQLVLEGFQMGAKMYAQKTASGVAAPTLSGTLNIDPNGLMSISLANLAAKNFLSIANPNLEFLESLGFAVTVAPEGATRADIALDTRHVWLPKDYYDRLSQSAEAGNDFNLVTLQETNERGQVTATWPPKALNFEQLSDQTWVVKASEAAGLRVRYEYDGLGRMIRSHEPDAGMSEMVYDRHNRVRLMRNAKQAAANSWQEMVFDTMGRVIETRVVQFYSGVFATRETLQQWFDDLDQAPADAGALENFTYGGESYRQYRFAKSSTFTYYDRYRESTQPAWNRDSPTSYVDRVCYWPSTAQLEALYPWNPKNDNTGPIVIDLPRFAFGHPHGKVVEIFSTYSAERLFYDTKGRVVCRVQLIRNVLEPQITWIQYDNRDLPIVTYNQTHNLGIGFVYDAFGRVVQSFDLTPHSNRMSLNVIYKHDQRETSELVRVIAGPLVDRGSNLDPDAHAQPLAAWNYAASGHVTHVRYGDPDRVAIENQLTYDIRDWLLGQNVTIAGEPAYGVTMDYFGLNDCFDSFDCADAPAGPEQLAIPMYDGSIAVLSETYYLEGAQGRQTRHEYRYDGIYQLSDALQLRGMLPLTPSLATKVRHQYAYDRNGNRMNENQEGMFTPILPAPNDVFLQHTLVNNTNRLDTIEYETATGTFNRAFRFEYDEMGNVVRIERDPAPIAHGQMSLLQNMAYNDRRFSHLPSSILNYIRSENPDPDAPFKPESRTFLYDHNGRRVYRSKVRQGTLVEETYYVPFGNDNAAELDDWGRARRVYLFSGQDRIGYKSKAHTAMYIKDHLGSTKMVVALNRDLEFAPSSGQMPITGGKQPEASSVVDLGFNQTLVAEGVLEAPTFNGEASYVARAQDEPNALWLDRNESLVFPDSDAVARLADAFTISLWLYDADPDDGQFDHSSMVTVGNGASIRYNPIHFYLDGNKLPVLRLGAGSEGWQFFSRFTRVPQNNWTHLAVSYDGTHVRCYQNGELLGDPDPVTLGALYPARDLAIGNWLNNGDYAWEGALDEILIEGRALSQSEIRAHYLRTKEPDTHLTAFPAASRSASGNRDALRSLLVLAYSDSDAFGVAMGEDIVNGNREVESHGFTGQETEHGTGLVYMGGRWYMPAAGRRILPDPVVDDDTGYRYPDRSELTEPELPQREKSDVIVAPVKTGDPFGTEGQAPAVETFDKKL